MFNFTHTLTTLLLVGTCTASHAAEYWISKKGSDANNCSSSSLSCLSIQKGLNILKPGDILNIDEGTYIEDSTNSPLTSKCGLLDANYGSLCVKSSGTAENPITIRAVPDKEGKVIIDSEGKRAGLIISKHDFIRVQGLTFLNNWTAGIATPGGPANTTTTPSDDILSIGCEIVGNTIENTKGAYGVNISGIYMWSTKNWIVRDNTIKTVKIDAGTEGNGIQTYGTINAIIENNNISDVDIGIHWKDHYIMAGDYQESIIKYNALSVANAGIRISIRGDGSNPAGDNQIENNVIELLNKSSVAIAAYLAGANAKSRKLDIKRNLFIGRSSEHIGVNADSLESLTVTNNIFANMDIAISLRLQNASRPAILAKADNNIYGNNFQIIIDRYDPKGDSETFRDLNKWQYANAIEDQTLESITLASRDLNSKLDSSNLILSKPTGTGNYSDAMPEGKIAGPYDGKIIGVRPPPWSAPDIPKNAKSRPL